MVPSSILLSALGEVFISMITDMDTSNKKAAFCAKLPYRLFWYYENWARADRIFVKNNKKTILIEKTIFMSNTSFMRVIEKEPSARNRSCPLFIHLFLLKVFQKINKNIFFLFRFDRIWRLNRHNFWFLDSDIFRQFLFYFEIRSSQGLGGKRLSDVDVPEDGGLAGDLQEREVRLALGTVSISRYWKRT